MAWPGTPGGISSPAWGPNVQLYVWAAIASGSVLKWGPDPQDRYDSGNVWSSGGAQPGPTPPTGTLWVDVGCDILDLNIHTGSDDVSPFTSVAEAGTCDFTLRDEHRKYDPLNPDSPYQFGGVSRLGQGVSIRVFAETLASPSTVTQWNLFVGTVDSWDSDWQWNSAKRQAKVVASDCTKLLQALNWGEQPAIGNGDYQMNRVQRILTYYGWTGPTQLDQPLTRYQATTLAQSAWELLGRTITDGNGFLLVNGDGAVQTSGDNRWSARNPTVTLSVGCGPDVSGTYDIAMDVDVGASEIQNSVTAGRAGGTQSTYRNATSVLQYQERGAPTRTDLGLYDDTEVSKFASTILNLRAYPRGVITSVLLRPQRDPASWPSIFRSQQYLSKEAIRVLWQPPDSTTVYDVKGRPFGVEHTISRNVWEVRYALALADVFTRVLHWGPHAYDKLDSGNVYV